MVGTSGSDFDRVAPKFASGRSFPDLMCESVARTVCVVSCALLPSTAVIAGPPPLVGRWRMPWKRADGRLTRPVSPCLVLRDHRRPEVGFDGVGRGQHHKVVDDEGGKRIEDGDGGSWKGILGCRRGPEGACQGRAADDGERPV